MINMTTKTITPTEVIYTCPCGEQFSIPYIETALPDTVKNRMRRAHKCKKLEAVL